MAIRLYDPTDLIPVEHIPLLIYGPPGTGKTTLAQMTDTPVTLDFDNGIRRSQFRGPAIGMDAWADVIQLGNQAMDGRDGPIPHTAVERFRLSRTLIIDTGGRALDTMIPGIISENQKNGYAGSLSPQGWGVLGNRFNTWMKTVASWKKQVVMVCHQAEFESASGDRGFTPEFPGKMAAKEVFKTFDLIGRLFVQGNKRFVSFNPSEQQVAKNSAYLPLVEVPDFREKPNQRFLADLIEQAKAEIGKTAQASAAVAADVAKWREWLEKKPELAVFNGGFADVVAMKGSPVKVQAGHLLNQYAASQGWTLNRDKKCYEQAQGGGA